MSPLQTASRRRFKRLLPLAAVLAVAAGVGAWRMMFRVEPVRWARVEDQFAHGSIGAEPNQGVPYYLWMVLPRVFPQYLPGPGGYASLGFTWVEGEELPVGFSKMTVGFPRVAINCAVCHTGTWRASPQGERHVVPAAASTTVDMQAYQRFLMQAAADARFNADVLMPEIEYAARGLSASERALYRNVLIPQTRDALLALRRASVWQDTRPDWGPGRIDPFNQVKFVMLRQPMDNSIGNSDMMPIWALRERQGKGLHWDGLQSDIHEVALSSALGDGASRVSLQPDEVRRLTDWLQDVQPPRHPFPVYPAKAERGRQVYAQAGCVGCHGTPESWTARLVPVARPGEPETMDRVATDRHRIGMWTQAAATTYNHFAAGYTWKFDKFRKQDTYLAAPLNGLWLRAPYLHNGSVPTLWHLLRPEKRPATFYRGYDVYDPAQVGWLHTVPREGPVKFFLYDTSKPGNSNRGHAYGSTLSEPDKDALLEYLKTL